MKELLAKAAVSLALLSSVAVAPAGAALIDRGLFDADGSGPGSATVRLVYDDDLNITWLGDANFGAGSPFDDGFSTTDGRMTWASANSWAASLTVGGFTDWRLPTTLQPDPSCTVQTAGTPPQGSGFNCTGSEMGHLFYTELGGTAGAPLTGPLSSGDPDPDLALFINIQRLVYWSGTEFAPNTDFAWSFDFLVGGQGGNVKVNSGLVAWAVRPGDVSAPVPVPGTLLLLGSGLAGLVGFGRKKGRIRG